jgi:uncharacterized protein YjbI with pentapeptide repeats
VSFDRATFVEETSFQGREFRGPALFRAVEFRGPARFTRAVFRRDALFGEILGDYGVTIAPAAAFGASAAFPFVTFEGAADFTGARFSGATAFEAAVFHNGLVLERAVFDAEVDFADAALAVEAVLRRSRFKDTVRFDRMTVAAKTVDLEGASFAQHVALEVDAARVSLRQAQFHGGVTLRAGRGDIAVEEAEFGQPSSIAAPAGAPTARAPRIVSLRGSQVGRLVLSDVDLRACRFEGAHNLAGLRIEGTEAFERAPHRYRSRGRQAIAEEHEWRRDHPGPLQPSGWHPDSCAFPNWLPPPRPREPHQIAATYRDLRKGREESRDEPGAADFYYGEMEMRRHSGGHAPRAEQSIVWLYWLVSGYGLRASRALTGLAVTVLVFALLLSSFGFERTEPRRGFGQALIFALESTTSLLRGTDRQLTDAGEVLWIVLRLLGPLFFGLALLSLRGRVKR